ncbi:DUF5131 family protein [Nocardia sp. NPDC051570]|uniref:DUF5131 family protein n=1 Tax=Nocardia sp. NPDC051570 TaxID=3364324 RepID=UPI003791B561
MSTTIEWTGFSWNPSTGCDRISPECDHCYALTMAKRLKVMGATKYQNDGDPRTSGPGFGVTMHPDVVLEPVLKWSRTPRMVFVDSMSDVFHARISVSFLGRIFATMALTPQHTYQVLTKRPNRMHDLLTDGRVQTAMQEALLDIVRNGPSLPAWNTKLLFLRAEHCPWPLPNVWLGPSIGVDEYCWRADELRQTPAAVRFLSCEPLLGPLPSLDLTDIDWVIIGGESGRGFRPLDLDWVRDIRDRCQAQTIALFFKQVGGIRPKTGGRFLDGRTWDEYPPTNHPAGTVMA